jgi:putative DNA primase/helicase
MTGNSDNLTVLTTTTGKFATKQFSRQKDGSIKNRSYGNETYFSVTSVPVNNIHSLAHELDTLVRNPRCFVIRGEPSPGTNRARTRRLALPDRKTGEPATFEDQPRRWFSIDGHHIACPALTDPATDPEGAVEYVIGLLPPELHDATCWWQFSSSQSVPVIPGAPDTLSLHLWYWSAEPIDSAALTRWALAANQIAGYKLIGPEFFRTVQAHYTAAPIFNPPLKDPLARRCGLRRGLDDAVNLIIPESAPKRPYEPSKTGYEPGIGVAAHLREIGGPKGFRNPIMATIASYIAIHGSNADVQPLYQDVRTALDRIAPGWQIDPDGQRYLDDEHLDKITEWVRQHHGDQPPKGFHPDPPPYIADPEIPDCPLAAAPSPSEPLIINSAAPYDTARVFRNAVYQTEDYSTIFYHRGAFYHWTGTAYPEMDEDELRAELYRFLDQCVAIDREDKKPRPFKPNKSRVANIVDALQAAAILPGSIAAPAWLEQAPDLDPADIIPCANGLLHLPTLDLLPSTPLFFSHNALDYDYDRRAPPPAHWLEFLAQLWPDDQGSIGTLQEIFGLCLTADTRHQKAFLLIGPRRSGKGTIARILVGLVGRCNAVAPTLGSLGERFGLAPLIGKLLAVISDARLGAKADQHAIAESILRISGEDDITADRKNRESWTGRLRVRFMVVSNELPRLADASGALASRFIILRLVNSFYGREDQGLTDRLLTELPGILNWAIAGLQRLRTRGYLVQPASATEAVQELEDLSSPIGAFIRERCEVGPGCSADPTSLFEAWGHWCKTQGRDHPGTLQTFGRDLRAALPTLSMSQPRLDSARRARIYQGIRLRF